MLALTTLQTAAVAAKDYASHLRVFIDRDGTSNMTDVTNVEGFDWLESAEWNDNADQNGAAATITLRREEYNLSLATLMQNSKLNQQPVGSYVPFLTVGRRVRIETAVVAIDTAPSSSDWINRFEGEIDELDDGGDGPQVKLTCRDLSGYLIDRWVESLTVYAQEATGLAVETVMQQILTAWAPGVTLYVPVSPAWVITAYEQTKEPVLDALRKLAQQIGWDVKYKWDSGSSAWRLTLYSVDRAKVVPDYTFTADQIEKVSRLSIARTGVRNVVKVVYTDGTTNQRVTTTRTDAPSIVKYGRRFMEAAEDAASQIDSLAEANVFADAMLADLKEPTLEKNVELSFFPFAEVGDLYRFPANSKYFDAAQDLAVVGWGHSCSRDRSRSAIQVRGKPCGGFLRWLRIEARSGVASAADDAATPTPANVFITPTLGGLEITYDMPTNPDWSYSECHLSKTNGFTPSPATKVKDGRTNKFTVGGLEPGFTYYVVIIAVDTRGNKSTASTQVAQATALVGPGHDDNGKDSINIIPNGEFLIWSPPNTRALNKPDEWETVQSTSGADIASLWGDIITADTTLVETGDVAIKIRAKPFFSNQTYLLRTKSFIPVTEGATYRFSNVLYQNGSCSKLMSLRGFQSDKVTTVSIPVSTGWGGTGGPIGSWFVQYGTVKIPAGCKYVKACVGWITSGNPVELFSLWVDRVWLTRIPVSFEAAQTGAQTVIPASTATLVGISQVTDNGTVYENDPTFGVGFVAPEDGEYNFAAQVGLFSMVAGKEMQCFLYKNGAAWIESNLQPAATALTYTVASVAVTAAQLSAGDVIQVYVWHNDTVNRNTRNNAATTWFNGIQTK